MITPRPHNQRNSSYQYQSQYGYASNNTNYGQGGDPQLPFPPAIPPPPLPPSSAAGSSWGGFNNNNNNNGKQSMVPGGTWQTAAIYSGAYTANQLMGSKDTSSPEYQQHFGTTNRYQNETVPIANQVPPYIANKETFPHQVQRQSSVNRGDDQNNTQQQQRPRQTASGLEVHAMQRLVSSAKTRFAPSSNNNNNNNNSSNIAHDIDNNELVSAGNTNQQQRTFYDPGQDYFAANNEQNQIQMNVQLAEQHARREQLLNSHRESGGVAFERKLKNQRERNINNGRGGVVPSVLSIDGTFRRTQTPTMNNNNTNNYINSDKTETSKLSHLRKERNERYIPLSQAQTSQLINKNGLRPSSAGISRKNNNTTSTTTATTVKARLKGEAPDLKKSLAEGFAMRFQPEQIEQMQLPESVGQAALEIARYRTAAGGYDNARRQNNQAPDSSYINGIGDMFTKMKGQYLQMQKLGGGGGGGSQQQQQSNRESPIPRNPQQQLFFRRPGGHLEGGNNNITSPLKAGGGQVFIAGGNNNNTSRNNNNIQNNSMVNATPLYSIAGTGAFRDQNQTTTTGFSPRERNQQQQQSPLRNKSTKELVRFEPPQPSARALALRAELELLEAQWKELHNEHHQQHNNNTKSNNNVSSVSPEPQYPNNNTRDQVLSRINAVLR